MGALKNDLSGCQGISRRDYLRRAPLHRLPLDNARGEVAPASRAIHFSATDWIRERAARLSRICVCLDKGRAEGKTIRRMLRLHVWRWKGRHYISAPGRPIRFSCITLSRAYRHWRANGRNPDSLVIRYRPPIKLRKSHALRFAGVCINSDVRSMAEAYARLPRPRATVFAYRLAFRPKLLRRIVRLFAARRLVDCRARAARAVANSSAKEVLK
jgi:hypothetical protein